MGKERDEVLERCNGQWREILMHFGFPADILRKDPGSPCPKCGGEDRFTFPDWEDDGGIHCRGACGAGSVRDGIGAVAWFTNRQDQMDDVVRDVAKFVGIEVQEPKKKRKRSEKEKADPTANLKWKDWTETFADIYVQHRSGCHKESLRKLGTVQAMYRETYRVFATPIYGEQLTPVGWAIESFDDKGVPIFTRNAQGVSEVERHEKKKNTYGSERGVFGHDALQQIKEGTVERVWLVEGLSDVNTATFMMPEKACAISLSNGADQRLPKWLIRMLKSCKCEVVLLHDADTAGSQATRQRAATLNRQQIPISIARLPYQVVEKHGKDLRDWAIEKPRTYEDLCNLILDDISSEDITDEDALSWSDDDPYRIAQKFCASGHYVWWEDVWYVYEQNHYVPVKEKDIRGMITSVAEKHFQSVFMAKLDSGKVEEGEFVYRVGSRLVTDVMEHVRAMARVGTRVKSLNQWLEKTDHTDNCIAFSNCIVDIDAILSGCYTPNFEDQGENVRKTIKAGDNLAIFPNTHKWFSPVVLPYAYEDSIRCPKWLAFLDFAMDGDKELIGLLQEWVGYCLTTRTDYQCFMMLVGPGGNGKSVFCAAMEAILGEQNVSHVQLEAFQHQFALHQTMGKKLNICPDANEIDRTSEGTIKAFAAGDPMFVDRKNIDGVEMAPTAKLMISTNNPPHISDRTEGIWRRLLLVPWTKKVSDEQRITGMDKAWWWLKSGETPGMFTWAMQGLERLRVRDQFDLPEKVLAAVEHYRQQTSTARQYLQTHWIHTGDDSNYIPQRTLFDEYRDWARNWEFRTGTIKSFTKEVRNVFPAIKINQKKIDGKNKKAWVGIRAMTSEEEAEAQERSHSAIY